MDQFQPLVGRPGGALWCPDGISRKECGKGRGGLGLRGLRKGKPAVHLTEYLTSLFMLLSSLVVLLFCMALFYRIASVPAKIRGRQIVVGGVAD